MKLIVASAFLLLALSLTSCSSTGIQPKPTALEEKLFNITTNVTTLTNMVTQTNFVSKVEFITNTLNQVVMQTNQIPVPVLVPTPYNVTNYTYATAPIVTTAASTASIFGPIGTIAGTALAGLFGIFAAYKNNQANTSNAIAASGMQAIETARNVIAVLPNGTALVTAYNNWLVTHQADANILTEVGALVDKVVNTNVGQAAGVGAASQIVAAATTPIAPLPAPVKAV